MLPTGSPRPTSYAPSRKFPPTPSQGIRGNSLSNNRKALFCGSLALGRRFGGFALGGSPFGLSGGSGFGSLLLGDRLRTLLLHLGLGSQTCLLGSLGVGGDSFEAILPSFSSIHLLNLASASDSEKAPLATPPSRCFL